MPLSFFDTNVLIYAARPELEPRDEYKRPIAIDLLESENFVISAQVLAEFYHNTVKKGDSRLSHDEALEWIETLAARPCSAIDTNMVTAGAAYADRYRISYWDGAMLAAANAMGAETFYTEDLNDGQKYGSVTAINPFRNLPN